MPPVIKVENLSKAYQLGEIGTGTLTRDLERYWARVRGKEDPFLKIGEVNDRSKKGETDIVWSLKDINFDIEQGDAVGIIGRNGAGKSTLLKILSRVTAPTTGSVKVKGRIASLLEVGTGFHPELSGKENIYLNGAILGMRKAEIKRKFEEIVDFSGVERYIDTPVKRYSSGMYVRLAFAVAAHLESEILIVDEVLAVGDAEFQKKCLGKMGDVSKGEGRTVLFVSHNMSAINQLCNNAILLKNGGLESYSSVKGIIEQYLESSTKNDFFTSTDEKSFFKKVFMLNEKFKPSTAFLFNQNININFEVTILEALVGLTLSFIIKDSYENAITSSHFLLEGKLNETLTVSACIPANYVIPGNYRLESVLHIPNIKFVQQLPFVINFMVEDSGSVHSIYIKNSLGQIALPIVWEKSV